MNILTLLAGAPPQLKRVSLHFKSPTLDRIRVVHAPDGNWAAFCVALTRDAVAEWGEGTKLISVKMIDEVPA